jgi:hypothetical protein
MEALNEQMGKMGTIKKLADIAEGMKLDATDLHNEARDGGSIQPSALTFTPPSMDDLKAAGSGGHPEEL